MDKRQARARGYWRSTLRLVQVLLVVWFGVSIGLGVLLVEPLNRVALGGFPLGFWIAQQGSIFVFILLIFTYARIMDGIDARYGR